MATKRIVVAQLARGEGCLGKADEDEPVFVLRSTDVLAPQVLRYWIALARQLEAPQDKIDGAVADAAAMTSWQRTHQHLVKVPD